MTQFDARISRRGQLAALAVLALGNLWNRTSSAFGSVGLFRVRHVKLQKQSLDATRETAAARWAWELMRRTSASARLEGCTVAASSPQLCEEPFAIWSGADDPGQLTHDERHALERFLRLGGLLVVDDSNPVAGGFGRGARRELAKVISDSPIQTLGANHVVFKSFYLLERSVGRAAGSGRVDAILRGRLAQVLILDCDLLGALATNAKGDWTYPIAEANSNHRELAIRLAVNIAMYLLCSDYKDDQVHAAWLMRHGRFPRK